MYSIYAYVNIYDARTPSAEQGGVGWSAQRMRKDFILWGFDYHFINYTSEKTNNNKP